MRGVLAWLVCLLYLTQASAASFDAAAVDQAQWRSARTGAFDPAIIKAQVLLDRAHFSPGEIDGKMGENFKKALAAFAEASHLPFNGKMTPALWQALAATSTEPIVTDYTLAEDDVAGPFLDRLPTKLEDMRELPALSYTSAREKIAEKFHMSESLLSAFNREQAFKTAGETIKVVNVSTQPLDGKTARIEIDKAVQTLRAFDRDGKLLGFFPITAGSTEKPAPSGRLKVTIVKKDPIYHYNPKYAFKGVHARKPFTIKPGPNNPVGVMWIGLSGEGYGIHGTPDPSQVSKTASHGCIRMTNWDVLELAATVAKGTPVDFIGDEQANRKARVETRRTRRHH